MTSDIYLTVNVNIYSQKVILKAKKFVFQKFCQQFEYKIESERIFFQVATCFHTKLYIAGLLKQQLFF